MLRKNQKSKQKNRKMQVLEVDVKILNSGRTLTSSLYYMDKTKNIRKVIPFGV